jgi:uncharacterized protein (DUF952 family)
MLVYKICTADEWATLTACGIFAGSPDDLRDGFIHLSAANQVARTAAKFFAGRPDLVLLSVDIASVGDNLRWEGSPGGNLYPHLYAQLPIEAVVAAVRLDIGPDGRHILPPDVT